MQKSLQSPKQTKEAYDLDQCALYKVRSKRRLAEVLGRNLKELTCLSKDKGNYKVFELPESICVFTGKKTKARLVHDPIPELKSLHRRIQTLISRVKIPDYCHGGAKGRSYRTNAHTHVDSYEVATFDLKSFFSSTTAPQIFSFFRNDMQCAADIAGLLTDLCTYKRALPTGSPLSPLLAFWANRALFATLDKRAKELDLKLSVYVDDVTISGRHLPRSLPTQVEGIVTKFGHKLATHKTRVFGHNSPKHVTGVVIHRGKLSVPHTRFQKARSIYRAISMAADDAQRESLAAKLGGLLGEAAYIDARYKPWAKRTYAELAHIKARRAATTLE